MAMNVINCFDKSTKQATSDAIEESARKDERIKATRVDISEREQIISNSKTVRY